MAQKTLNAIAFFTLMFVATGWAQQRETIDVRLTRIEESIKVTNQRIEELAKGINQRIDDMNQGINKRIDDTNQRIDAGFNLLIAIIGILVTVMGVVVWFARQERPVSKKHYDKLLQKDEELGEQFDKLAKEDESKIRRLAQHERRMDELSQKLNALETEITMRKNPATYFAFV